MKKHIIILAIITSAVMLSCNDKLDLPNDGRISLEEVFSDRNMTRGYLNSCYNYGLVPTYDWAAWTDEAQHSQAASIAGSGYYNYYEGNSTANNSYLFDNVWSRMYEGIRKCNVFLSRIDNANITTTDAERAGWKSQAYTLRAYYYLQLIKRYGGVILITEPFSLTHDFSQDKKSKFSDVVKQIIEDCRMALTAPTTAAGFPWNPIENTSDNIMYRAITYAIMSQAITYAVSPLWDDGTFTLQEAVSITKEALDQCLANGFRLYDVEPSADYAQNAYAAYHLIASHDVTHAVDKETIYHYGGRFEVWRYAGLPTNADMSTSGPNPTQEIVDAYEMQATGIIPISGYSDANHLNPIITPGSGYNENDPYTGRDPRFYASIYYNGADRNLDNPSEKVETYVGGLQGISSTDQRYTHTGYYLRKFNNWRSSRDNSADGSIRVYRLAELYLNFAEVAYQAVGPDQQVASTVGGSAMSARQAVNAIRARSKMPDIASGLSPADFETRYRNERRIELAFEGHRYFDVRRWKILNQTDRVVTGMRIINNNGTFTYNRFTLPRQSYTDKYLLFPIPQSEINKIYRSTGENWQNPGWEQ